jgi:hypothetical protein
MAALRKDGVSILTDSTSRTFKNFWLKFAKGIKTVNFYADLGTVPRNAKK